MTSRSALIVSLLCVGVTTCACLIFSDAAFAQTGPFGAPRPPPVPSDGIVGWILTKQAMFYRELSGLIRAAKTDGSAVWTLLALSFAYGIFHAAGPGHGKAVISSYLVANNETWRRGVILSFVSAMIQALIAIALVAVAAGLIGVTSRTMGETVRWIEIASYGLIALVGVQLIWTKGRSFLHAWRTDEHAHAHGHDHAHSSHDHDHDHHHDHDDHAGHSHGPMPEELAGPGGWRRGLSAIVAVGLR
ncbi:MAG: nickel/cobalt transporter, partial [Rhizomicrobium sp.]